MESILDSIKKLLGIQKEYTAFDPDIIMHINSVFVILNQINVGPKEVFSISDSSAVWSDFITEEYQNMIKSYIHLKVKLMFDPPASNAVIESISNAASELEWRLYAQADEPIT